MNERWNLDPIYTGFDDPSFEADLAAAKEKLAAFSALAADLAKAEPLDALKEGIRLQEQLSELAGKLGLYASLRQSTNSRDQEAVSQLGRLMALYSGMAAPEAAFKDWASKLPNLMELVDGDEFLKPYHFLFENMADSSRYLLPGRGEEIMARMRLSGGNAWSDLQGYLTSTVPVSYNGGTTNLPAIRNLAYDPDPAVRKAAYEAELACYDRIKDSVAFALNSIKLETISDCRLRGYASPLERTVKHNNMKMETLNAMLEARNSTPVANSARLADLLRRPQVTYADIAPFDPDRPALPAAVTEEVEIQIKYAGYLARQEKQVAEFKKEEARLLPADIDYDSIAGLRLEARQKLSEIRPMSIGQAGRISGVSPADIAVLLIWLEQR